MPLPIRPLVALLGLLQAGAAHADDVLVAVAASFVPPMQAVAESFEATTGHSVRIVSGSTGGLYAQIVNGAPFDVFVAADAERPRRLEASGHGVAGTRATVAVGRLVLFGRDAELIRSRGLESLRDDAVRHIAIANPRVAPYGTAARQALETLGLWRTLSPRIVRGESVAQTYAMIATGNAELGFVALAQVVGSDRGGAYVPVPDDYYAPIRQDVIVLARAHDKPAARAIRDYLLGEPAREIIRAFGYATDAG